MAAIEQNFMVGGFAHFLALFLFVALFVCRWWRGDHFSLPNVSKLIIFDGSPSLIRNKGMGHRRLVTYANLCSLKNVNFWKQFYEFAYKYII